jgi:hypothetical protein
MVPLEVPPAPEATPPDPEKDGSNSGC